MRMSHLRIYLLYFAKDLQRAHKCGEGLTIKTILMEQMNRIELKGNVGNIRITDVGDSKVARFSLATNFIYKGRDGDAVVETTWHNIVAWDGRGMPDLTKIGKGTPLYVCGRLRSSKYTAADGSERTSYEVVANKISFGSPEPVQCGI